jgi:hypothetical protein
VLVSLGGLVIRATWPEYVAVAQSMQFTLPMLIARLALSTVTLLIAAGVTFAIAKREAATLALGIILVVAFIPQHIKLWHDFPVWYHAYFLLTLIPLCILGGRIAARIAQRHEGAEPAASTPAGAR